MHAELQSILKGLWALLFGKSLLPFLLASFGAIIAAATLASLDAGRATGLTKSKRNLLWFLHWSHGSPLLAVPLILAYALYNLAPTASSRTLWDVLTTNLNQDLANYWLLGLFGFIFHSYLTYFVLAKLFQWETRLDRVSHLCNNLASFPALSRLAVRVTVLGPPIGFCWAMVFIFLHSMRATPKVTQTQTLMRWIDEQVLGLSNFSHFRAAAYVLLVFLLLSAFLMAGYYLPKVIGLFLTARSRHRPAPSPAPCDRSPRQRSKPRRRFAWRPALVTISLTSAVLHLVITGLGLAGILLRCPSNVAALKRDKISAFLLSMVSSPAVLAAFVAAGILTVLILTAPRALARISERLYQTVAITPSTVLAAFGLLCIVHGQWQKLIVGGTLLFLYSSAVFVFAANPTRILDAQITLKNASNLRLPPLCRGLVWAVSDIGTLPRALLLTWFWLWMEDGIQSILLSSQSSLANQILGITLGFSPEVYVAVLIAFGLWITLAVLCLLLLRTRSIIATSVAKRIRPQVFLRPVRHAVPLLLASLTLSASAATAGQAQPLATLHDQEEFLLCGPESAGGAKEFPRIEVAHGTKLATLRVQGDRSRIRVNNFDFGKSGALVTVVGDTNVLVDELEILNITSQPDDKRQAPRIKLRSLRVGRLLLSGVASRTIGVSEAPPYPEVDMEMAEGSEAVDIVIENLAMPDCQLRILTHDPSATSRLAVRNPSAMISSSAVGNLRLQSSATPSDGEFMSLSVTARFIAGTKANERVLQLTHLPIGASSFVSLTAPSPQGTDPKPRLCVECEGVNLVGGGQLVLLATNIHARVHVANAKLAGSIVVKTTPLPYLELDEVAASSIADSRFEVVTTDLPELKLNSIDLHTMVFDCASIGSRDFSYKQVSIRDRIRVRPSFPSDIVKSSAILPLDRSRILKLLQDSGEYLAPNGKVKTIGVQALYYRKRADFESAGTFRIWVLDLLTGFGVDYWKPLATMGTCILLHFLIRLSLISSTSMGGALSWATLQPAALGAASTLIGMDENSATPRKETLQVLRKIFLWLFQIQIAVWFLYLGGTVLQ